MVGITTRVVLQAQMINSSSAQTCIKRPWFFGIVRRAFFFFFFFFAFVVCLSSQTSDFQQDEVMVKARVLVLCKLLNELVSSITECTTPNFMVSPTYTAYMVSPTYTAYTSSWELLNPKNNRHRAKRGVTQQKLSISSAQTCIKRPSFLLDVHFVLASASACQVKPTPFKCIVLCTNTVWNAQRRKCFFLLHILLLLPYDTGLTSTQACCTTLDVCDVIPIYPNNKYSWIQWTLKFRTSCATNKYTCHKKQHFLEINTVKISPFFLNLLQKGLWGKRMIQTAFSRSQLSNGYSFSNLGLIVFSIPTKNVLTNKFSAPQYWRGAGHFIIGQKHKNKREEKKTFFFPRGNGQTFWRLKKPKFPNIYRQTEKMFSLDQVFRLFGS